MSRHDETLAIATVGLAIAATGTFLPWARIGGRRRSGYATADTFVALADAALPDWIAWIGRWWYAPAFLAVLAWGSVLARRRFAVRAVGVALVLVGLTMWWVFVWGGEHWDVLDVHLAGPIVATTGMVGIGYACARPG